MKKDPPKLGGVFKEGFSAALADGSVLFIRNTIDPKLLKLLINIQDGTALNWDDVPVRNSGRRSSRGGHDRDFAVPRTGVEPGPQTAPKEDRNLQKPPPPSP
jgi:hypothetical protein